MYKTVLRKKLTENVSHQILRQIIQSQGLIFHEKKVINQLFLSPSKMDRKKTTFHLIEGVRANLGMAKKVTICKKSTIFFLNP